MKDGTIVFPTVDLPEDRKLTLAATVRENGKDRDKFFTVRFGYSVKNPKDDTNEELGQIIAKGRADKTPLFAFVVRSKGVSKALLQGTAKLIQDEFANRFGNYITVKEKKVTPQPTTTAEKV